MTKIKKNFLGKQYEIRVSFDEFNTIWISVSEVVRPTWKIFRTHYIDHRVKFIEDFSCVEDAVNTAFFQIMFQEKKKEEIRKKIEDFQKKCLTNE